MASPTYHLPLLLFFLSFLVVASLAGAQSTPGPSLPTGTGTARRSSMAGEFLRAHNQVRRHVGEAPYAWNRTLARYARRWANQRQSDCQCIHSGGPYGENMFWGTGQGWRAADAVRSWAMEHYDYDRDSNSCRPGRMCGHYTQIVWNATIVVGCARAECIDGGVIITCNYDPPGNFVGEGPFDSVA